MNQFQAVSDYLQQRIGWTRFDDVDEYRQLLLLERLILRPLRAWPAERMFIGLSEQFPRETKQLIREFAYRGITPDEHIIAAVPRHQGELARLLDSRRYENREHRWRERAAWLAAGGQP